METRTLAARNGAETDAFHVPTLAGFRRSHRCWPDRVRSSGAWRRAGRGGGGRAGRGSGDGRGVPGASDGDRNRRRLGSRQASRWRPDRHGMRSQDGTSRHRRSPEASRKSFIKGVKELRWGSDQGLGPQIVAAVKEGGSYKFLHQRARDKHKTALFRLVIARRQRRELSLSSFLVMLPADGQRVRAVDTYVLLSGELISQTIRWLYLPADRQVSHGLLGDLALRDRARRT